MKIGKITIRNLFVLSIATLISACSTPSPRDLEPPTIKNPNLAQITAKREFRLVGGGTSYIHDIYDVGTGIKYNADVSEIPHLVFMHEITPDLFKKIRFNVISGRAPVPWNEPPSNKPLKDYERLVEDIDENLIGKPMIKASALNQGGVTANSKWLGTSRGKLQRVKLRQLYDRRNKILYRTLKLTNEKCFGPFQIKDNESPDLSGIRDELIAPAFRDLVPDFSSRSLDFFYGELCGLFAPFDLELNGLRVGSFDSFSPKTWLRPPGRMALKVLLGGAIISANEIEVEAGKRYVGIYDPNNLSFVIESYDH